MRRPRILPAIAVNRSGRSAVRAIVVAVIIIVGVLVPGAAVHAHTEVQRASPGPADTVGGTVDAVDIVFLDPVLAGSTVDVLGPDGASVAGLATPVLDDAGRHLVTEFAPLTAAGRYEVRLRFVAADGDGQEENYTFTFRPDGSGRGRLVAAGAVSVAVVVAVALAMRRRRSAS